MKETGQLIPTLMRRDGLTEEDATELVREVQQMMSAAIEAGDYLVAEEIFTSELGLEPDYMMEILPV